MGTKRLHKKSMVRPPLVIPAKNNLERENGFLPKTGGSFPKKEVSPTQGFGVTAINLHTCNALGGGSQIIPPRMAG